MFISLSPKYDVFMSIFTWWICWIRYFLHFFSSSSSSLYPSIILGVINTHLTLQQSSFLFYALDYAMDIFVYLCIHYTSESTWKEAPKIVFVFFVIFFSSPFKVECRSSVRSCFLSKMFDFGWYSAINSIFFNPLICISFFFCFHSLNCRNRNKMPFMKNETNKQLWRCFISYVGYFG